MNSPLRGEINHNWLFPLFKDTWRTSNHSCVSNQPLHLIRLKISEPAVTLAPGVTLLTVEARGGWTVWRWWLVYPSLAVPEPSPIHRPWTMTKWPSHTPLISTAKTTRTHPKTNNATFCVINATLAQSPTDTDMQKVIALLLLLLLVLLYCLEWMLLRKKHQALLICGYLDIKIL